ncbi:MAG: glycosyltransferase, partial [Ignavibacteriae bacterium]|nr:glycosyltransferase [Ignavibacteriota bacterium]
MEIKPFFSDDYFTVDSKFMKFFIVTISYLRRLILILNVLFFKRKPPIILIEYEIFPFIPAWFEYLLKLRQIPYIVDYDDAIFHKYDSHKNSVIKLVLKNKIAKVMQYADTVITGNNYLFEYAKKWNDKVIIFPTVVMLDKYDEAMKQFVKKESDNFIIGWIGSKSTSKYVLEIKPVIKEFCTKHRDVQFNFIGFEHGLISDEVLSDYNIHIIPWSEETEIKEIMKFDIGIMPLTDDPWSRGKCGF